MLRVLKLSCACTAAALLLPPPPLLLPLLWLSVVGIVLVDAGVGAGTAGGLLLPLLLAPLPWLSVLGISLVSG